MRKILFAIVTLCTVLNLSAAEKGDKSLGVLSGYNTRVASAPVGLYFQYNFSSFIRVAPDLQFVIKNNGKSFYTFNANVHFLFKLDTKLNAYPLAGVTYQNWRIDDESYGRLGLNVGAGLDFMVMPTLKLFVEGRYTPVKNLSSGNFLVGIGYKF